MTRIFRTDDATEVALTAMPDAEGISRQEVLRRADLEHHARHGHEERVGEATDRAMDEWRDVLDRLGRA